jgi:flagellar biosynthesis/type III secretory pathway M-ring protein FliF/YscJ
MDAARSGRKWQMSSSLYDFRKAKKWYSMRMKIDTGLAIVILAVLVFYLRLIIIQRQRAKSIAQEKKASQIEKKKSKKQPPAPQPDYSVISKSNLDRGIAIGGVLLMVLGILLYIKLIPLPFLQPYWWVPTAAGIILFSWAFKL